MKLPSNLEVQSARDALQNLRSTLGDIERSRHTTNATTAITTLQQLQQQAQASLHGIENVAQFSPELRLLLAEGQRLSGKVDALVSDLQANRDYRGPRKDKMSTKEKSAFIKANGLDAFVSLKY